MSFSQLPVSRLVSVLIALGVYMSACSMSEEVFEMSFDSRSEDSEKRSMSRRIPKRDVMIRLPVMGSSASVPMDTEDDSFVMGGR